MQLYIRQLIIGQKTIRDIVKWDYLNHFLRVWQMNAMDIRVIMADMAIIMIP